MGREVKDRIIYDIDRRDIYNTDRGDIYDTDHIIYIISDHRFMLTWNYHDNVSDVYHLGRNIPRDFHLHQPARNPSSRNWLQSTML